MNGNHLPTRQFHIRQKALVTPQQSTLKQSVQSHDFHPAGATPVVKSTILAKRQAAVEKAKNPDEKVEPSPDIW
jgi:hypothetical protein